jgi:hypothetical protein
MALRGRCDQHHGEADRPFRLPEFLESIPAASLDAESRRTRAKQA